MITHRRNESAPAGLEVPTGATPHDVRGDGHPLRATYDGPASFGNAREVLYVALDTGEAITHLLRRDQLAPTRWPSVSRDVREARVLAYDADASQAQNEEHATLVLNCLVATGTARVVPLQLVRALAIRQTREAQRLRELEAQVAQLQAENASLLTRRAR